MSALDIAAVEEEEAHYSLVIDRLTNLLSTLPAIAANDPIKVRLEELRELVTGWHRSTRAVEMRLKVPED